VSGLTPSDDHATHIVVWDTPYAIEPGAAYRIKVGVKCAAGCSAAGRRIEIRDADGRRIAGAAVGDAAWPGTAALYYADVEVRAPASEGLHAWEASVGDAAGETADGPAHAAASTRFQVRVVPAPQFVLKVIAVDARSGAPVPGAKVVVHPYRAMTNGLGVAEIRVARGSYRLFVSGCDRFPFRSDGEVTEDTTIRAELDPDLGPSDAELWT
jgi:hypothetical protein